MWTTRGIAHVRPAYLLNRHCRPAGRQTLLHHRDMMTGCRNNAAAKRSFISQIQDVVSNLAARLSRNSLLGRRKWSCPDAALVQTVLADFGRRVLSGRGRDTLLSAACLSVYNWEEYSAAEQNITEFVADFDFVTKLTEETLTCIDCKQRLRVDQEVPNISYCSCSKRAPAKPDLEGWKPFIERPNTLVWRKEHESYKGLYAYKMYARLDRVTAVDFLRVQLDTDFRKEWDSSATELRVIEESEDTNSDLVYWRTQWPKPFANRDYVFQRRLTVDKESRVCVISSTAASHPSVPAFKSMHRVTQYWSFMVVRPFSDFNKAGVEFVLTYFDNPGLSIPSSVSTWVAMTGLPNFVTKLEEAAMRVSDLPGPEPRLLSRLREQLASPSKEANNNSKGGGGRLVSPSSDSISHAREGADPKGGVASSSPPPPPSSVPSSAAPAPDSGQYPQQFSSSSSSLPNPVFFAC